MTVGAVVLAVPQGASADPVPYDSVSRSCDGVVRAFAGSLQSPARAEGVYRIVAGQATGGLFPLISSGTGETGSFKPGDVIWQAMGPVADGSSAAYFLSCSTPGIVTVDSFESPRPPTSFAGRSSSPNTSVVSFSVPDSAPYMANVSVAQGAVRLDGPGESGYGRRITGPTTARLNLGRLSPGVVKLRIAAVAGPPAQWNVAVSAAVPAVMTAPRFTPLAVRPATTARATYSIDNDARLSASVLDSRGAEVRLIGENFWVTRGDRSLTWNGRTADGRPLPTGIYTLRLSGTDVNGFAVPPSTGSMLIDGTRPTLRRTSPYPLPRNRAMVITVTDRGSGVASGRMTIAGRTTFLRPGTGRIAYRPPNGWARGRTYPYTASAKDRVGNSTSFSGSITIER